MGNGFGGSGNVDPKSAAVLVLSQCTADSVQTGLCPGSLVLTLTSKYFIVYKTRTNLTQSLLSTIHVNIKYNQTA